MRPTPFDLAHKSADNASSNMNLTCVPLSSGSIKALFGSCSSAYLHSKRTPTARHCIGFTGPGPEFIRNSNLETTAVSESCFLRLKNALVHIFLLRKSYFG